MRSQLEIDHQEHILFNDTILSNIVYGKFHASAKEVIEAANIANTSDFIEKLSTNSNKDDLYTNEFHQKASELP